MKSKCTCPACGKPLTLEHEGELVTLFCGHGPCHSISMNCGAQDTTELAAHAELENMLKREENQSTTLASGNN